MQQSHPLYLIYEGFLSIESFPVSEDVKKLRIINNSDYLIVTQEDENGVIWLVNVRTLERVSVDQLMDQGILKM